MRTTKERIGYLLQGVGVKSTLKRCVECGFIWFLGAWEDKTHCPHCDSLDIEEYE